MTPSLNGDRLVCRVQLTGDGRWVSLSLSLSDLAPGNRFVAMSESLVYALVGLDELAKSYGVTNWQGGVISGARYAFRMLKAPHLQVRLRELRGQLNSDDVSAVSAAAAVAVARLLALPAEFPVDLRGWKLETEIWRQRPPAAPEPVEAGGSTARSDDVRPAPLP